MQFTVGFKHFGNTGHLVVEAEDALIAALKVKMRHPEALIAYVRRLNRRGDLRQARIFELRAAMSMARLWRDQGKRDEARELLALVYGWFTEDPENERVFWVSIYPKLLPVQLAGDKYSPVRGDITFTWKPPAD